MWAIRECNFGGGENSQVDLVEAAPSSAAALLTAEAPTDRLNNYVEPVATIQSVEKRSTPEAVQATEVPTVQTSYAGMGAFDLGDLVSYKAEAEIVNLSTMSEPHLKVSSVGDYTMNSPHLETEAPVKLVEKLPELFTAMAAPDELLVAPERDLSEQRGIDRNVPVEVAFSEAALKTAEVLEEVTPDAVPEAFEKVLIEEGDSALKIAARDLREQGVETEVEPAKVIERMAQYAQINGPDFASKPHLLKAGDYLLVPKINGQTADCNLNRVFTRSGEACEIVKVGAEMGTKALANNYTVTYDPKPGAS